MAEAVNIAAKDATSQSGPSNFAGLDTETQQKAFRALAAAALIYAGAYFAVYVADWLTHVAANGRFHVPPLHENIAAAVSITYSLMVANRCRWKKCSTAHFPTIATLYLVVSSLGIAANLWEWESLVTTQTFNVGVSWVGLWIVFYPSIVTLPPKRILVASLFAGATVPAVATLSVLVHGVADDFNGSPTLAIVRLSTPILICVGIAYASAYRVFVLARDVYKARRLGSYHLTEKIGAGGMGEVWKGEHKMLRRPAAIKLIRPQSLGMSIDSSAVRTTMRRFEREAQATALLTSPHSIMLYDFGVAKDGMFYYVMELLEGRDFKTLIQEHGPVPAERAVHFLRAACDSLGDAHHRGLIHRDIKPANLFTCRRGRDFDFVKVLDFGLVKDARERTEKVTQLTGDGVTSGTPGFMAPELITGDGTVDGRSDIYALGCVAYWLLSGQLVFDGRTPMAILVKHVKEEPARLSTRTEIEVPRRLEDLLVACLAKRPGDRPASVEELGDELAELAATLPAWTHERAEKWWRTHLPEIHAVPVGRRLDTDAPTIINA